MATGMGQVTALALLMQPMIGLPSGRDRVRWKLSASSPHPVMTPRILAPRARAASWLSRTRAPAPSAITKPSRFLPMGFTAAWRGVFLFIYGRCMGNLAKGVWVLDHARD